jgi:hypothetical protein
MLSDVAEVKVGLVTSGCDFFSASDTSRGIWYHNSLHLGV